MKTTKVTSKREFEAGQVWQMGETLLEVTLVGRTLIHFRRGMVGAKRSVTGLLQRSALEIYLAQQKAVMVKRPTALGSPRKVN